MPSDSLKAIHYTLHFPLISTNSDKTKSAPFTKSFGALDKEEASPGTVLCSSSICRSGDGESGVQG